MKIQIVCAFLLAIFAVTFAGKDIGYNDRYIVLLKEGATDEQIEEVIQLVEGHEGLPREELFIESYNTLLPFIETLNNQMISLNYLLRHLITTWT